VDSFRLYLCGDSTAGKTTLASSLCRGNAPLYARPELGSTRGISVFTADLAAQAVNPSPDIKAMFNFWDFAGQQDYHVSHSLFVDPQAAVFLVLLISRKANLTLRRRFDTGYSTAAPKLIASNTQECY
jgi:GTPase SAR1 family protein